MIKTDNKRIEELEARLAVLEYENVLLADRAEDTMLLSLFSELAGESTEYASLLKKMLERVSIIKDITFCSCGVIGDGKIKPIASYCSCIDEEVNPMISLGVEIIPMLENGLVILENEDLAGIKCEPENLKDKLGINEMLIFPFKFEMETPAVFVFGNNGSKENDSLKQLIPLLQQLTYIVEDRINTLYLLEKLKAVNAELEERVLRRTSRLEEKNRHLKSEIEKRKLTEEKLEFSEDKFKEIFNNANDIIILWSADERGLPTKVLEVNERALSVTGYSREEFLKLERSQLRDPEESRNDSNVTADIMTKKGSHTFELTLCTKQKKKIPTEVSAHLFMFQGEYVVLAIHRDISERKEFERQLIKAKELAEESDKLKSAFLANMSHEIRTPMNAIIGFTDLLHSGRVSPEDQVTYTKIIQQKGEQLMSLINDILHLSKIEADQIDLNPVFCKMSEFMKMAEINWQNMIDNSSNPEIELKLDFEQVKELELEFDELRVSQVLNNLVSNAIKFTHEGSVAVSCLSEDNKLFFLVEDTGIGIPEEKYALIFDRFRQVDEGHTRKYGGTGLGLAICKRLVSVMGGEIGVESVVGKSSRFWFTIPCNNR